MPLTKDQILQADDLELLEVPVPEWGDTVFVRSMTGAQRAAYDRANQAAKGGVAADWLSKLLSMTLCDQAGALLFSVADVGALMQKSGAVLGRIGEAAAKHNGFGAEVIDDLADELGNDLMSASGTG